LVSDLIFDFVRRFTRSHISRNCPEAFFVNHLQQKVGGAIQKKLRKAIQAIAPDLGSFANQ
jgi:hypothetical protein